MGQSRCVLIKSQSRLVFELDWTGTCTTVWWLDAINNKVKTTSKGLASCVLLEMRSTLLEALLTLFTFQGSFSSQRESFPHSYVNIQKYMDARRTGVWDHKNSPVSLLPFRNGIFCPIEPQNPFTNSLRNNSTYKIISRVLVAFFQRCGVGLKKKEINSSTKLINIRILKDLFTRDC